MRSPPCKFARSPVQVCTRRSPSLHNAPCKLALRRSQTCAPPTPSLRLGWVMGGRREWAFRDKKKASFLVYFEFLHGGEGRRDLYFRGNRCLSAQDCFCVAVEDRATLAAHHLLGFQEIQAHLQALSASSGRPDHAGTGLIRRQPKHKAVGFDRRERGGRFQLLYLG